MVKTRNRSRHSNSGKRSYRRRVRSSHCRGKGRKHCKLANGCKRSRSSMKRRSFCRKAKNTRRHRR